MLLEVALIAVYQNAKATVKDKTKTRRRKRRGTHPVQIRNPRATE